MADSTLDLRITLVGDNEVLNEISEKLISSTADNNSLCDALSAIVKQTLIDGGSSSEFEVKIHKSQVKRDFGSTGGLSASEWMEQR
jgi:hypothetical protein